jgi:diacylglycerol kinase (ATP)
MDITLIHNSNAGDKGPPKAKLIKVFERAGHEVAYHSTKRRDLRRALESPGDVVVAAGGDGTVGKVARRLIGRNVPIAILPLGAANNIASALGLDGAPRQLARALAGSHPVKFDVGIARGPWGDVLFVEGVGLLR